MNAGTTLRLIGVAWKIFQARRMMMSRGRNEGTDVPVWHAQERLYRAVDPSRDNPDGYLVSYDETGDEWQFVSLSDFDDEHPSRLRRPARGSWTTIPGAVFLAPEEADLWVESQRHNYPDGLRRYCASCKRGTALRTLLEVP